MVEWLLLFLKFTLNHTGIAVDQVNASIIQLNRLIVIYSLKSLQLEPTHIPVYVDKCYVATCKSSLPVVKPFALLGQT